MFSVFPRITTTPILPKHHPAESQFRSPDAIRMDDICQEADMRPEVRSPSYDTFQPFIPTLTYHPHSYSYYTDREAGKAPKER